MNRAEIDAFRAAHNLSPLPPPSKAKKKNNGNAQRHADACRDLKAVRAKGRK